MKNKKVIYLLAPLVLIIWGLVLYRIFRISGGEEPMPNQRSTVIAPDTNQLKKNKPFSIVADYRDPFLGTYTVKRKKPPSSTAKGGLKKKPPTPPPVAVNWPVVSYGGVIINQQSNQQIAIVTVGEREGLLAINQELQGIVLKKIFNKDSIEVSFNSNRKTIRKK